jgi:polysaccharide biosynthesis transport protein
MNTPNEAFDEVPVVDSPQSEVHLSDYWAIVVKYKRLILLVLGFWLLGGGLVCFLMTPLYRAVTTLDISRVSSNSTGFDGSATIDGLEFLPSQVELVQSRDVAERVVKKLNLLSNQAFLDAHPDLAPDPSEPKPSGPPTARQISRAAFAVLDETDASIVKATSLVQITYDSPSRDLAAQVANALADAYIEWNIESRFQTLANSAQFLATQIEEAKRDIDEKERALLAYTSQKEIIAVDTTKMNPSRDRLAAFQDDYTTAVADRVSKEAKFDELVKTPDTTVAETVAAGVFAQMKSDQGKLETDYTQKLAIYKPEWPAMQAEKQQVEEGNRRIAIAVKETADKVREAARSDYLTALRKETSMKEMMRSKQSEALNQIAGSSEYNNLRTEIDTKRALLDTLIREQGEAEVLSRLREEHSTNIRIVDRALRPHRPNKPKPVIYMAAAVVLGCGMGFGLAFFLSYLDRTLHSSAEVERFVQLPVLGSIPRVGPSGKKRRWWAFWRWRRKKTRAAEGLVELLPHSNPRAAASEAYRALRTSLLFSRAGGVKVVTVTSVVPKEGKTATSANLAVVLAQLGRRVLLVDADFHQGRVHQLFGVSNRAGLVSILAEGVEPSRVIVKTKVPGVFVVTSGPDTPNPSALLSSENMRQFLELAATNFDHVVIDTPPIMATYDVLVFGQYTDGVVLCVRAGVTGRQQVREVRDKLLRAGVPILGVVLNRRKLETSYYEYRYLNYGEKPRVESGDELPEATGADELEAERGVVSGA